MVCILMASFTILLMHHKYDWLCCTIIALCSLVYFPILWIESGMTMFPQVYRFLDIAFSSGAAWLGCLMCLYIVYLVRPQYLTALYTGHVKQQKKPQKISMMELALAKGLKEKVKKELDGVR